MTFGKDLVFFNAPDGGLPFYPHPDFPIDLFGAFPDRTVQKTMISCQHLECI